MIRANDRGLANPTPPVIEEPPKAGLVNTRNLIVLVGIVAWIALILLFVVPNLTHKPAQQVALQPTTSAAAAATTATTAPPAAAAANASAPKAVPLPELDVNGRVFNLSGTAAGYKYVKLSIVVQFADPKGQFAKLNGANLAKQQTTFAADHASALVAFNDILTSTVSNKTAADLSTPQGKEALRQELIGKFNAALAGTSDRVTYVLFSDFVMQ